jgi:serine/threonine protein kinase
MNSLTLIGFYIANELFFEILQGLSYLHKLNPPIIHGNLKPSNIMINHDGNGNFIKLSDVGLNALYDFDEQTSRSHTSGNTKYIAFETFSTKKFDEKSDIYSLGAIAVDLFNFDIKR